MAMNYDPSHPADRHEQAHASRVRPSLKRSLLGTLAFAAAASVWVAVDVVRGQHQTPQAEPTDRTPTLLAAASPDDAAPATRPGDAAGEQPRRRPGTGPGGRLFGPGMREGSLGEFRGGDFQRRFETGPVKQDPPTAEEWTDIAEFAKTNLPNRWKMFQDVVTARGEAAPVVKSIKQRIAVRYRTLQRTRANGSRFYDKAAEQLQLEDDVWGEVRKLKNDPQNEALRASARNKVQVLVQSILDERGQRIDRMKEMLEGEENSLAQDRENVESFVDTQMAAMLSDQMPGDGAGRPARPPGSHGDAEGDRPRRDRGADNAGGN